LSEDAPWPAVRQSQPNNEFFIEIQSRTAAERTVRRERFVPFFDDPRFDFGEQGSLNIGCISCADDFAAHGVAAIRKMRETDNTAYVKVVSNVLPREALVKALSVNVDVDAGDFPEDASIESILETVASEAGVDAAMTLASMFGLEVPESISPPMLELNPEADEIDAMPQDPKFR
jgi:hypothetical protein